MELYNFAHIDSDRIADNKANWYVEYYIQLDETILGIEGSDGIGVFFIVLDGHHVDEFKEIIEKYKDFNPNINGCLGECIRFACTHKDLKPNRSTIGGIDSHLSIKLNNYDRHIC